MAALIKNIPNNPKNTVGNRGLNFPLNYSANDIILTECLLYTETLQGVEQSYFITEGGIPFVDSSCGFTTPTTPVVVSTKYSATALFEITPTNDFYITCYGTTSTFNITFRGNLLNTLSSPPSAPLVTRDLVASPGTRLGIGRIPNGTWGYIITISDIERGVRKFLMQARPGSLAKEKYRFNVTSGYSWGTIGSLFSL